MKPKYEYMTRSTGSAPQLARRATEAAQEGWRLVDVVALGGMTATAFIGFFERPA
jgi:hypothetical protein